MKTFAPRVIIDTKKRLGRNNGKLINLAAAFAWRFALGVPSNRPELLQALEDIQEHTHLLE